jgi:hypothetical protein
MDPMMIQQIIQMLMRGGMGAGMGAGAAPRQPTIGREQWPPTSRGFPGGVPRRIAPSNPNPQGLSTRRNIGPRMGPGGLSREALAEQNIHVPKRVPKGGAPNPHKLKTVKNPKPETSKEELAEQINKDSMPKKEKKKKKKYPAEYSAKK